MAFYHNKVANFTFCPDNCVFISYSTETKNLQCECGMSDVEISTLDFSNLIGKNTYQSFYSTLKYSNYKVMRCYNLVFNFKILCHNIGSIIILIFFVIYLVFMNLYFIKDISSIKIKISKILFDNNISSYSNEIKPIQEENIDNDNKIKSKDIFVDNVETQKKIQFPPRKRLKLILNNNNYGQSKANENMGLVDNTTNRKKAKNKTNYLMKKNNIKISKKLSLNEKKYQNNTFEIYQNKNSNIKMNEKLNNIDNQTNNILIRNKSMIQIENKNKSTENPPLKFEDLDNFELNNLDYIPACEVDERSFCRTYWSVLLREQIALITFFACNDYNIFYIKMDRFIIQFITNIAMNGLFFADETMHNIYVNNGENDFIQQIPQMLYSLIVGHVLEVILCYLSLTDTSVYMIKELSKNKENGSKILNIIRCIKIKLTIFFVFTFLLFLFYWYFVSAFCAVYQNTQWIFMRDSMTSFLTSMIDPFLIYAATNILRVISLSTCCKKKASFVYNVSQFFPIF